MNLVYGTFRAFLEVGIQVEEMEGNASISIPLGCLTAQNRAWGWR